MNIWKSNISAWTFLEKQFILITHTLYFTTFLYSSTCLDMLSQNPMCSNWGILHRKECIQKKKQKNICFFTGILSQFLLSYALPEFKLRATGEIGEVTERPKVPVLKTGDGLNRPRVRIPASPPLHSSRKSQNVLKPALQRVFLCLSILVCPSKSLDIPAITRV